MANINMDLGDWLRKQLEDADADMLREMVTTMAEMPTPARELVYRR